jgi:hypothetical protein
MVVPQQSECIESRGFAIDVLESVANSHAGNGRIVQQTEVRPASVDEIDCTAN